MRLAKALGAFCTELLTPQCHHPNVVHSGQHCPDCGQGVVVQWIQTRCQRCETRRMPKKLANGSITPAEKHCRFCGEQHYRVIKKPHIERYELPLSLLSREVDTTERLAGDTRLSLGLKHYVNRPAQPFQSVIDVVVE